MAPLSGKMHIMLFFNNTSKVKEGPLNLAVNSSEVSGQTTDLSVSLLMSGWSGPSMLFYPERYDWFYLYSLIGSDQCSQLMRLGLQDCPRKAAHSVSSLSFLTLLLVLCILPTFLSLWRLGPPWKKMKCWWGRKLLCRDCLLSCFELTKCNVKWEGESLKRS